jgi:flagellar FliL protein
MADNTAKKAKPEEQATDGAEGAAQAKDRKSMILMILVCLNSVVFLGVGYGLYSYSKATKAAIKQETEIEDPSAVDAHGGKAKAGKEEAKVVALETFYINLSGSEGYKLMKVTMSLEVDSAAAQDEILKRQAHIRDVILVLLSSKQYGEVSGENAQTKLKEEIMDTVNSFLTKGKIKKILFTDFLFN